MAGNKQFGERLRKLRELRKASDPTFTLRQFAEKVGISPTFISKIERGEFDPPRADKIIRMAELLDIDPDELLSLAGKYYPELGNIIKEHPTALPDLLRTVRGMSEAELRKLTERARKQKD